MLHVLLVEDNPADAQMVREAIRASPVMADVMIAYDGEQALQFVIEFGFVPDIVFLDLTVPGLNSFGLLEHLHANHGPPVLVLTGSTDPANRRQAKTSGAKEYIVKPSDVDEFLIVIRDAIERWGGKAAARGL
jgi:DNA-binding response OmpR family regulator